MLKCIESFVEYQKHFLKLEKVQLVKIMINVNFNEKHFTNEVKCGRNFFW